MNPIVIDTPKKIKFSWDNIKMLDDQAEIKRMQDEKKLIFDNRVAALKRKRSKPTPLTQEQQNIIKANYAKVPIFYFKTDCKDCREFLRTEIQEFHNKKCLHQKDDVQPSWNLSVDSPCYM